MLTRFSRWGLSIRRTEVILKNWTEFLSKKLFSTSLLIAIMASSWGTNSSPEKLNICYNYHHECRVLHSQQRTCKTGQWTGLQGIHFVHNSIKKQMESHKRNIEFHNSLPTQLSPLDETNADKMYCGSHQLASPKPKEAGSCNTQSAINVPHGKRRKYGNFNQHKLTCINSKCQIAMKYRSMENKSH